MSFFLSNYIFKMDELLSDKLKLLGYRNGKISEYRDGKISLPKNINDNSKETLFNLIRNGQLDTQKRVKLALDYIENASGKDVRVDQLLLECGVGVVVSQQQIQTVINETLNNRSNVNIKTMMKVIREKHPFVDCKIAIEMVKQVIKSQPNKSSKKETTPKTNDVVVKTKSRVLVLTSKLTTKMILEIIENGGGEDKINRLVNLFGSQMYSNGIKSVIKDNNEKFSMFG